MHNNERQTRAKRIRWGIAGALLLAAGFTALFLFPPGLHGPERSAGEFLQTLIAAPADVERLRSAAHIAATDDPQALLQGLSTDVTLNFLRARQTQGSPQDIRVVARQQPTPERYGVTLRVSDANVTDTATFRYFVGRFETAANGEWRLVAVRAAD